MAARRDLMYCFIVAWCVQTILIAYGLAVSPDESLAVRLVDGPNNSSGRLEVKAGGAWGTVCRRDFNRAAAVVVCKSIGYNFGTKLPWRHIHGAATHLPRWLDDVRCRGNESSLLQCSHSGWDNAFCREPVGIMCDNYNKRLTLRLVDGINNSSGRLEVRAGGRWGTVCKNRFDTKAADVVCKSLGFSSGIAMWGRFKKAHESLPAWLDDVTCTGNESSLLDCSHSGWGDHDSEFFDYCRDRTDVGVMCDEHLVVRLVDGPNNSSGRLEVKAGRVWGTVCEDRSNQAVALVACKSIGYNYGVKMVVPFDRRSAHAHQWLGGVHCGGNEGSLLECKHGAWSGETCWGGHGDIGVVCDNYNETLTLRLVDGINNSSGRLEVRTGGRWGTVCRNNFTNREALVACQSIGYSRGIALWGRFKRGHESLPIWLDDVKCIGNESSLLHCSHRGWAIQNCTHREDVGVMCDAEFVPPKGDLMVRLIDGPNNWSGRLEVRAGGRWGTVCADEFDQRAVTVACQSIGFNHGSIIGQFGRGKASSPIWLDDVRCNGNESSLLQCSYVGWGLHNCDHARDVGVICDNYDGNLVVRLAERSSNASGRLEIKAGGRWGSVCANGFDYRAATVACKQIGFSSGLTLKSQVYKGVDGTVPMWLDEVKCIGNETSLLDCTHDGWGSHDCTGATAVNISCDPPSLMVRLVGGPNNFTGRLEVKLTSTWGTVCSEFFGHREATVVCKTMGYNYGINTVPHQRRASSKVPIWLNDVKCLGNEASLLQCSHDGWGAHDCPDHYGEVGIACEYGNFTVRLVDGWSSSSGRLEVRAGGKWGTVCDDHFDHTGATVACKSIGFTGGFVVRDQFGTGLGVRGTVPIWLSNVRCLGNESSLLDCSHRHWGSYDCAYWDLVGVRCVPSNSERLAPTSRTVSSTLSTAPTMSAQGSVSVVVPWLSVCISLAVVTGIIVTIILAARQFMCKQVLDDLPGTTDDDETGKSVVKYIKLPRARNTTDIDGARATCSPDTTNAAIAAEVTDETHSVKKNCSETRAAHEEHTERVELPL